jgi:hypothetical protein
MNPAPVTNQRDDAADVIPKTSTQIMASAKPDEMKKLIDIFNKMKVCNFLKN